MPNTRKSVKVVIIGDAGVGKSTLLARISRGGRFDTAISSTIGANYQCMQRKLIDGSHVSVWDTAGQERFNYLLPNYFRNCDLVVMCFRIGDMQSVEWLTRQWYNAAVPAGVRRCVVVGTQSDLKDEQSKRMYWNVASDPGMLNLGDGVETFLTSSKTGDGVEQFVENMYARLEERGNSQRDLVDLNAALAPTTSKYGLGKCKC